jgi:dynein heavy chain
LTSVADKFLAEVEMEESVRESVIKFLPQSFEDVQKQCEEVLRLERRYIYTTPKSFLELIKLFKGMLAQKKGELEG